MSVVIGVRNAQRELPTLLAALERQTLPRDRFEVLVADDASDDATAALVEAHPLPTLLRSPARRGQTAAVATALERARGRVIALTDADCEPTAAWLEHGLRDLDALGVDLLGGHVHIPLDGRPTIVALIDVARHLDQESAVREAGYAVTANLFFRRAVLEDVGHFTPGLRAGGDVEWVLRATSAGHRLGYSAGAAVSHPARATAQALARKSFRTGYGTGQFRYRARGPLREHGPAWRAPSSYRPMRHLARADRIVAAGHRLSRPRDLALDAAHYALVQIPFVVGSLVATVRRGRH